MVASTLNKKSEGTPIAAEHYKPSLDELRDVANRLLLKRIEQGHACADHLQAERDQLIEALMAMEEERDRYRDLYARAPVATLVLDAYGAVREMNGAAGQLLEIAPRQLLGTSLLRLLEPTQKQAF